MRNILFVLVLTFFLATSLPAQGAKFTPPLSDRTRTNIDFDWGFFRGDINGEEETHQVNQRPWKKVNLPHEWSIEGPYSPEHNLVQAFLPMEIGWYKKELRLPGIFSDKQIYLIFDGAYRESDVWINYAFLGHHTSGYTSFVYDITDYVRPGDNTPNSVRVRLDGQRHEQDAYEGTGIYRHVWVVATNKLHVANWGTFVTTPKVTDSMAEIKVQTKIRNADRTARKFDLKTIIVDAAGTVVGEIVNTYSLAAASTAEFTQTMTVKNPRRWDVDDPNLYKAHTIIVEKGEIIDTYDTRFGIRTFWFDSNKGFFLNGRPLKLRGFNEHHDFAGVGRALPDRIHWDAMMTMKVAGFNYFRASHNPATPERLDVCDEIGMLVWDEIERKLESKEILLPLVEETIIRDRNHPSIIVWGLENESPLESTVFGTNCIQAGTDLAHKLDPTRPTTFAPSMPINKNGYGDAVDVVAYNYNWIRADQDHYDHPDWKVGAISEYSAKRCRRGVYGIEHFSRAEEDNYFDLYNGEIRNIYELCKSLEGYWKRIDVREYIGGGCLWSGIDYWGGGDIWPLISRSDGVLDLCFFPKDGYYYFMSQWTEKPMVHLFPHWNWEGSTKDTVAVWAYSNCGEVELFLNGQSLGRQPRPPQPPKMDFSNYKPTLSKEKSYKYFEREVVDDYPQHLEWPVPYQSGELKIVGYNHGRVAAEKAVRTAGKPAQIKLTRLMHDFVTELPPLLADGRDIVSVKSEIQDANGNVVPTAANLVTFQVEGAQIIGVGNGDIVSHEPNKANYRKAYNGLCLAIVQTSKTPGEIKITATSEGLQAGELKVGAVEPRAESIFIQSRRFEDPRAEISTTIEVEIMDKFGCRIESAAAKISLQLDGPAEFEAGRKTQEVEIQNGVAHVPISYLKKGLVTVWAKGAVPGKAKIWVW